MAKISIIFMVLFMGCRDNSQPNAVYIPDRSSDYRILRDKNTLNAPPDTVIIHDTIYRTKNVRIRKAEEVHVKGGNQINVNGDNNNIINQRN